MPAEDPTAAPRAYFAAINETHLDDLAAVFTEDALLSFPMLEPIVGRAAIRAFYEGVLQFYPERFDRVTRWLTSAEGDVAAEIYFRGRTLTGRPVEFEAVDLFRMSGGQIREIKIFYDSARVMQMIGDLPKQG